MSKVQAWSAFHFQGFRIKHFIFLLDAWLDLLTTWLTLGILNPAESASYIGSKLRRKKKTKLMEEERDIHFCSAINLIWALFLI